MSRIRTKLSYANVTATLAVFIALGGSSYAALTLPRDSVGSNQIRRGAVTSTELRDRTVRLRDLAGSTRVSLRGQQGPAGAAGRDAIGYHASVTALGAKIRGNARNVEHAGGSNEYRVLFEPAAGSPPIASCIAVAGISGGTTGFATADPADGNAVVVKTFGQDGAARELPFQVIVAC